MAKHRLKLVLSYGFLKNRFKSHHGHQKSGFI